MRRRRFAISRGRRRRARELAEADRLAHQTEARVDEVIAESFPASDAPCWTLGPPVWARGAAPVVDEPEPSADRLPLRAYQRARVIVLRASATVLDAARAMRLNEVGCVLVRGRDGVIGIVTDRDLALRIVAEGLEPRHTPVAAVMSRHLVALPPDATTSDALRLMGERGVRRVPILSADRAIGMVTLDDLVIDLDATGALAAIVRAQIVEGGPARTRRYDEWRAWARRYARAERSRARLVRRVREAAAIERADAAETALVELLSTVLRRMKPRGAARLLDRLPTLLRDRLPEPGTSTDSSASVTELEGRMAARLGVDHGRAEEIIQAIGGVVGQLLLGRAEIERMPEEIAAIVDPRRAPWASTRMARPPRPAGPHGEAGAPH